jgi:hypothetical protein
MSFARFGGVIRNKSLDEIRPRNLSGDFSHWSSNISIAPSVGRH